MCIYMHMYVWMYGSIEGLVYVCMYDHGTTIYHLLQPEVWYICCRCSNEVDDDLEGWLLSAIG